MTSLLCGVFSSLVAALIFVWIQRKLNSWYPTENRIMEMLKEADGNIAYKKTELLTEFIFIFVIWLFLGNFFWILAEFLDNLFGALFSILSSFSIENDYSIERNNPNWFRFGIKFLSVLCFYAGIKTLLRVYKTRVLYNIAKS